VFDLSVWLMGLAALLAAGFLTWLLSVAKRDVSIVDVLWSLLFLIAALVYAWAAPVAAEPSSDVAVPLPRSTLVIVLVAIWSLRLATYIAMRNRGQPEDYRYQAIRRRNDPGFAFKSLYLVFFLQAGLAWVISLPLLGAILGTRPLGWLDGAGALLWLVGFVFEPGGAWWALPGPLLMSVLLLRVSGVALLEKSIGRRRPGYEDYVRRTNAFFPGPARPSRPGT
jgi:steroid 5-alpha reductase family enzyme